MRVQKIQLAQTELEEMIPKEYLQCVDFEGDSHGDMLVFGALEEDEDVLLGMAVYSTNLVLTNRFDLIYISVGEDYRGQGIASSIIEFATNHIKRRLRGYIRVKLYDGMPEAVKRICDKYYKTKGKSGLLVYDNDILIHSPLIEGEDKLNTFLSNVKMYEDLAGRPEMTDFLAKKRKKSGKFDPEYLDGKYTRFFLNEGHIIAYIGMLNPNPNLVIMHDAYLLSGTKAQYSLPVMLLSIVRECINNLSDEARIVFDFTDYKNVHGAKKVLGTPIEYEEYDLYIG